MYSSSASLILTIALAYALVQTKHLIVDWICQPPYEHENKGIYGHWGGIRHAGKNALGTAAALALAFGDLGPLVLAGIAVFDFVVHYHIDWTKKQIVAATRWGPTTHAQFWWITGADQWAHQLTYVGIIAVVALIALG